MPALEQITASDSTYFVSSTPKSKIQSCRQQKTSIMSDAPAQPSSSFGGLKDFSVDAQRRMFIEQQERERQVAENKKASRKIKQATAGATGVALSGMMANMENGGAAKRVVVGDDDDDSIADDWSLDSEESFYVGIERADYAQPDNLEMYGESKEDDYELKEDRLGISRVSVAIINREKTSGKTAALDWDANIPINDEGKSSSLYEFMNGASGGGMKASKSKKDIVVAQPLVGSSLDWKEEGKLGEDDAAIDQVYQHKAAEGKMFIDKLVGAPSSTTPGKGNDASTVGSMVTPGMDMMTPGGKSVGGGNYPVLSPMALFSPGITTPGVVEGEDNGVRQMRERQLKKEANVESIQKMTDLKKMIATTKDSKGQVDAFALMKKIEKMLAEE